MLTKQENDYICQTDPGTPMGNLFRRFWIPFLMADELPSPDCPPVRARLMGEDLVAFKDSNGDIALLDAHCPHRLADLFFGRNEECGLRCVYHGWKFDINGECVDMPNEPAESNFKTKIRTTSYPCREFGGLIWAYMGPKEIIPEPPQLDWAMVPDSHRYILKMHTDSNYLQAVEGDIDNSHASFLHASLGAGADFMERLKNGGGPWNPLLKVQNRPRFNTLFGKDPAPKGVFKDTDYGIMMGWRRNVDDENYYWRINHWMMPFYAVLASPPGITMLCNIRIPIDDEQSWFFRIMWNPDRPLLAQERNEYQNGGFIFPDMVPGTFQPVAHKDNDYQIDRSLQRSFSVTGIKSIPQQDRAVGESMGAIVDRSKEHLGTRDVVIIGMRRHLIRVCKELEAGKEPAIASNPEAYRMRGVDVLLKQNIPFDAGARHLMEVTPAAD